MKEQMLSKHNANENKATQKVAKSVQDWSQDREFL